MLKMIYRDWNNSLHPNFIDDPESVLDCGFGSGNWAYDFAEYDPDCAVIYCVEDPWTYLLMHPGGGGRHLPACEYSLSSILPVSDRAARYILNRPCDGDIVTLIAS